MTPESYKRLYAENEELQKAYDQLFRVARQFVRTYNEFAEDAPAYQESFDALWRVVDSGEAENVFQGIRDDLAEIMAS
jgi:hypothetical protein